MLLPVCPWSANGMKKTYQKDTIFVGNTSEMEGLFKHLKRPDRVLGMFCDPADGVDCYLPLLGTVADVCAYLQERPQICRVYCSLSQVDACQAAAIQAVCKVRAVKFCAVLPVVNELEDQFVPMHVGRQLLLTPRPEPLSRIASLVVKRLFDVVLSLLALLTVFPVVYLCRYVIAKKQRIGAVLEVQRCKGPNGKSFWRVFFSSPESRESGMRNLPQLLNVLMGRMSLVGPSPVAEISEDSPEDGKLYLERAYLKAGMTGWSQLKKEDGRNSLRDDIWYVEHWSLWLDVCILFKTLFK